MAKRPIIDYLSEKDNNIKDINNPDEPEDVIGLLMKEWFSIEDKLDNVPMILWHFMKLFIEDKSPIIYVREDLFLLNGRSLLLLLIFFYIIFFR